MLINAFVYGTLRPGDYNFSRFGEAKVVDRGATAKGNLYHVSPQGRVFPVAKFDEDGTIVGDVLEYDDQSPMWRNIVHMEEGAGYEAREVYVRLSDGTEDTAWVFHYRRTPSGPQIVSGDWFNDETEFARS